MNWKQAAPSWLLLPVFAYEQLLQEPCCCGFLQLVSLCLDAALLSLTGVLSTGPPLPLPVLLGCEVCLH